MLPIERHEEFRDRERIHRELQHTPASGESGAGFSPPDLNQPADRGGGYPVLLASDERRQPRRYAEQFGGVVPPDELHRMLTRVSVHDPPAAIDPLP